MITKNPHIRLVWIRHAWWAKECFRDVSFTVNGWEVFGLVWANGSGKSTLLQIMSSTIVADDGLVETRWDIWLVTQWLDAGEDRSIADYLWGWELYEERECMVALWKVWADDLSLDKKLITLSGWQQTKIRVAKQLLEQKDILLLDEPTNHLDEAWVQALVWFVKRFHGPVVVVSHDRRFLEKVCSHIIDVRFGEVNEYTGWYSDYVQQREALYKKRMEEWKNQEKKRKALEQWMTDLRVRASHYDNPRWGKLLRSRQKKYDREFGENTTERPKDQQSMDLKVAWWKHKWKKIVTITEWNVHVRGRSLYDIETMQVHGESRVVIRGPNWSGKTTLLKQLKREREKDVTQRESERILRWNNISVAFYDQNDDSLMLEDSVMKRCSMNFPMWRSENIVRSKLASAWIPKEDIWKRMNQLSYGQRVKIRFIELMAHKYDLLILDEPTNHLDIDTRESLEYMLQSYEWAIIIVSHDRWFIDACAIKKERIIDEGLCFERDRLMSR